MYIRFLRPTKVETLNEDGKGFRHYKKGDAVYALKRIYHEGGKQMHIVTLECALLNVDCSAVYPALNLR